MSIRTFIFCDICNPQGLRSIEFRRSPRESGREGRRILDGRNWYEGTIYEATTSAGWIISEQGEHICPGCKVMHTNNTTHAEKINSV